MTTFYVIERNAFDKTAVLRGIHSKREVALIQVIRENCAIKNKSEWLQVIEHKEFLALKEKGLLEA